MDTRVGGAALTDTPGAREPEGLHGRLARGDQRALDELMEHHWPRLVSYATRLLGSMDAADDVVQSVFVRLWERRHLSIRTGSVTAYLYRATRNVAIDEQRRRRVRRAWANEHSGQAAPAATSPLEEAQAGELREGIVRALETLPPRRREVLELARFHGLNYRQIAEVMGISQQTVANQMSAALNHLRSELAPFLDTAPAGRRRPEP